MNNDLGSGERKLQAENEWRRGWRVLAGASIGTGVSYGLFLLTAGLFIIPMQEEFKWTRSEVSIGPMIGLLCAALAPFAGTFIDRYGARNLAIFGLVGLAIIYALLAVAPASHVYLYGIGILMAVVGTVSSGIIYCSGVVTWFSRNSGLAIGITMSGISIATAVALPMLASLIEQQGWRAGYVALGAAALFIGLPAVVAWFREAPRPTAPAGGGANAPAASKEGRSFGEALRDPRLWLCMACFGGAALPIGGFMSQMQPMLRGHGFSTEAAAAAGSVFALAIGFGRLAGGALLDRMYPPLVTATLLVLPALGSLLVSPLLGSDAVWIVAAVAVFLVGMGQGAEADFIAFYTLRIFGRRAFATIYATIGITVGGGMALGGLLFAGIFDLTGNYDLATYIAAGIFLLSALIALVIKVPGHEETPQGVQPQPAE